MLNDHQLLRLGHVALINAILAQGSSSILEFSFGPTFVGRAWAFMARRSHGGSGGGWSSGQAAGGYGHTGGNAAHNPFEVKLPKFLYWLEMNEDNMEENSVIMVDDRDARMVSPFQGWLTKEIMSNSASSINVLTERDQVMPPNLGFHLTLFGNYTLDGIKVVVVVALDTETGCMNAGWDQPTAEALSHPAFQPFAWPLLRDTSASYTDVKIYNGNEVLFHWIFRGYRSDTDLTVQQQFVDEVLVREANRGKPRLSVVVASFMGWRVTVFSFECGGRVYSVGPNGAVVATDHARSRFELRVCSRSSTDALGNDADRVEFRFRDANNRMDLKCQRTSVPGTWLTVSHISGPALIQTITNVRNSRARVEGPEHTEQFGQLAAVHQHWWNNAVAKSTRDVGCWTDFIGDLEQGNFHITCTSKLWVAAPEVVNKTALAEMQHTGSGRLAPVGPPSITMGAWSNAAEEACSEARNRGSGSGVVSSSAQADYEMARRSLNQNAPVNLSTGHVEDEARDQARLDRRYARSSAQITPAVFAAQISRKVFVETTATIEELPPGDLPLPHPKTQEGPVQTKSTPAPVPESKPDPAFEWGDRPQTPRTDPTVFKPASADT